MALGKNDTLHVMQDNNDTSLCNIFNFTVHFYSSARISYSLFKVRINMNAAIPDLRYEESFLKKIDAYSDNSRSLPWRQRAIQVYAIAKELVLMPFLQGLLWLSILILSKPALALLTRNGQATALYVKKALKSTLT